VLFEGYALEAERPIRLQAYDYAARRYRDFATLKADAFVPAEGAATFERFRFSTERRLPAASNYWTTGAGGQGLRARVRALQGKTVLSSFGAGAEQCFSSLRAAAGAADEQQLLRQLSRARAVGLLTRCQARRSPQINLRVQACGGPGQSCCDYHGGSERARCQAELSCLAGRCQTPRYPVPLLAAHRIDVPLPAGAELREAWLDLDDRSVGGDTRIAVVAAGRPLAGVRLSRPQADHLRVEFDLPLWQPGNNRVRLAGFYAQGQARHPVATAYRNYRYDPPPGLGHRGPGRFALPTRHFPMWMRSCRGLSCKDADGDGLNDLWENVALHQLRPILMMDRDDGFFRSKPPDAVRVISSVTPMSRGDERYILFAHAVAFTRDYGVMGLPSAFGFDHPGDTEAVGLAFNVGDNDELRWAATIAKGHHCLTCSPTYSFHTQSFDPEGPPRVFVERDKHGLWHSRRRCDQRAAFECDGDRVLRPPAVNAGEWSENGVSTLVDAIDRRLEDGPHAALSDVFEGEAIWSSGRAAVTGRFCGGRRRGCSKSRSANLPGDVLRQLLRRFQTRAWSDARTP